jgi:hypothetical protein
MIDFFGKIFSGNSCTIESHEIEYDKHKFVMQVGDLLSSVKKEKASG